MLKTSIFLPSTKIVVASHSLWWVSVRTLNLPELLYSVALLFLHLMLLSRSLFLKKIGILTIIYLLQMLSWLHPCPLASSSDWPRRICKYYKKPGHDITECYRKKNDDKRKQHQFRDTFPRPQAAAMSSSPVDDPVVTVSQIESMFHRYMSQSSPAFSVTSSNNLAPRLSLL